MRDRNVQNLSCPYVLQVQKFSVHLICIVLGTIVLQVLSMSKGEGMVFTVLWLQPDPRHSSGSG